MLDLPSDLPELLTLWAETCPDEVMGQRNTFLMILNPKSGSGMSVHPQDPTLQELYVIEGHARACIEKTGHDVETGRTRLAELDTRHATAFRTRFASDAVCAHLHASAPTLAAALIRLRLSVHSETAETGA